MLNIKSILPFIFFLLIVDDTALAATREQKSKPRIRGAVTSENEPQQSNAKDRTETITTKESGRPRGRKLLGQKIISLYGPKLGGVGGIQMQNREFIPMRQRVSEPIISDLPPPPPADILGGSERTVGRFEIIDFVHPPILDNNGGNDGNSVPRFQVISAGHAVPLSATNPPTTSPPTNEPTNPPTLPPTNEPTKSPTPPATKPPTSAPISDRSNARNDMCESASDETSSLSVAGLEQFRASSRSSSGGNVILGTTVGADTPNIVPRRCYSLDNSSPAVWYRVTGTGSTLTASLCHSETAGFDTKMTVYGGSCGSLECVAANDDANMRTGGTCRQNPFASRAAWESESGVTYYILVHGFGRRAGAFGLSLESAAPLNDQCSNVEPIEIGSQVVGTNVQAMDDFGNSMSTCDGTTVGDTAGVWYVFLGNGSPLRATTCYSDITNFDTKIHIFEGSCLDFAACFVGNDNDRASSELTIANTNGCSTVEWQSETNALYYIFVSSGAPDSSGLFELSLSQL